MYQLNIYSYKRKPKYIIIADYIYSSYCDDFNGYSLFEYYLERNIKDVYYIINVNTYFYKSLLNQNKTKNLILFTTKNDFWRQIFEYLLNSKIIIQSYTLHEFYKIINKVSYLKFLNINHGVRYFKRYIDLYDCRNIRLNKAHLLSTSPYEYNFLVKCFAYYEKYLHKAGLSKFDRFKNIKKNESENDCILLSFTYRKYNNEIYKKSLLKKNLESLLNNESLISLLKSKNIDLIYIPHHHDLLRNRTLDENKFNCAKIKNNTYLTHYIEQCSLFLTDFSSVSFDFMFLNKPVLFYLIDIKDKINFEEKNYMRKNVSIYFGNAFYEEDKVVEKIKYYVERNFKIDNDLKRKYDSVFFYKDNIRERIFKIVNDIINNY